MQDNDMSSAANTVELCSSFLLQMFLRARIERQRMQKRVDDHDVYEKQINTRSRPRFVKIGENFPGS